MNTKKKIRNKIQSKKLKSNLIKPKRLVQEKKIPSYEEVIGMPIAWAQSSSDLEHPVKAPWINFC